MSAKDHKCDNCNNQAIVWWHTGAPLCQSCFDEWSRREDEIQHGIDEDTKVWL